MAKNGAIDLIVSKDAQAQIDLLLKNLDEIEDKIITISNTGIGKKAGFVDVKSQKQLAESLEQNKKLSLELVAARKQLLTTAKQGNQVEFALGSAYDQLNISQKESLAAYNALTAKKAVMGKLTKEEVAQMKQLEAQLLRNQAVYKKVAAGQNALGISSKKTGVAFDSLGFSVAQLTRESPAFLNSVQTGFMALSNNIPIFVDEVDRLIKKNKDLKASGQQTKSVMGAVGKAFFSVQSLISISILLLTVLGPKLWEMAKGWVGATDALDKYKTANEQMQKVQEEGLKNSTREIVNLGIMNKAVQDVTKTTKERQAILNAMRDKYGEDIKHLTDREILTNGIGDAEKTLAKNILERARADAAAGLITENTIKLINLQIELRTLSTQRYQLQIRQLRNEELGYYEAAQQQQVKLNSITDDMIDKGLEVSALNEANNQLMEVAMTNTDSLGGKIKETSDKREKANAIQGQTITNFELEDQQIQKMLKTYQELADIWNDLEGFQKRQADQQLLEGFKGILEGDNPMFKIARDSLKDFEAQMKVLPPEFVKVLELLEELEKIQKNGEETQKSYQKNLQEGANILMQSLGALADIGAGFTSRAIQNIENEMDAMNEKYELQKDLINSEIDDEETKNQRLEELEKEKMLKEKEMQKKISAEKKKQAIIDRTVALFQIAISTAVWATRVGAEAAIFGIALQPLIWALGGLNAAAVLAQPVPQFAEGHLEGTYSGKALINDGGNVEVLARRGGQLELSTKKNKLINMQRGDKVHKDIPSFLQSLPGGSIMDSLHSASILSQVQMAGVQSNMEKRIFDEQFKEAMLDTMVKGFSKAKIVNDNRSVGEAVREAISEQNYTKKFL